MTQQRLHLSAILPETLAGLRLDQALAKLFPEFSRSQIQSWIENGAVRSNDRISLKQKERAISGQKITIDVLLEAQIAWQAEAIPLNIIYQDEYLFVINKSPGLIVHPGAGNPRSTMVNALLHLDPNLANLPRAGLIHRLDKDTSGLLLVARTLQAHHALSQQMQQRQIHRIYEAIVNGHPRPAGLIDCPIGRHPTQEQKWRF